MATVTAPKNSQQAAPAPAPAQPSSVDRDAALLAKIVERPVNERAQVISKTLESASLIQKIEEVLPDYMKGEARRLVKRAMLTFNRSPALQECSAESFIWAVVNAAEVGLQIDGRLAHAVPYNNKKKQPGGAEVWVKESQFQVDYKGLISIARRAGIIVDCKARIVYANDHFEYGEKDGRSFHEHVPVVGQDKGSRLGAYCVLNFPAGGFHFEFMDEREIMAIKGRSKAASKGFSPWQTDEGEMVKKTVIRRSLKLFAHDDYRLTRAIELDDEVFDDKPAVAAAMKRVSDKLTAPEPAAAAPEDNPADDIPPDPDGYPPEPAKPEQDSEDAMAQRDAVDDCRDRMQTATTDRDLQNLSAWMVQNRQLLGDAYDGLVKELKTRTVELQKQAKGK